MRKILPSILFLLFLISPQNALAVTVSVSNLPASIDQSQETEVDVALNCGGCGDSYLRGVFYPSGINYFGFTQNNLGLWIGTVSDKTEYFKVAQTDLVEASWSGKLKIKPDPTDIRYIGPGSYLFKVGRYTSSGDTSADWSNDLSILITGPTSTPTSTPTSAPTATATPTSTPTATPTKTPTPKPTVKSTSTSLAEVLGEEASPSSNIADLRNQLKTPTPTGLAGEEKKNFPFLPALLIVLGLGFMGAGGYLLYKKIKSEYNNEIL